MNCSTDERAESRRTLVMTTTALVVSTLLAAAVIAAAVTHNPGLSAAPATSWKAE